ncbi:MAG: BamA/TamA family outer membrane protein [Gloeomargarita sp. SKYG116]|nr:BamA/TamA family outer membrane protein [Gloeomargarita sp. SKYG116]MDW8400942.1 ShlB/FhaC/HecB family hemolysin secretion/activation protein [Gloeomargarita sp. SKYGB_i_bin116]
MAKQRWWCGVGLSSLSVTLWVGGAQALPLGVKRGHLPVLMDEQPATSDKGAHQLFTNTLPALSQVPPDPTRQPLTPPQPVQPLPPATPRPEPTVTPGTPPIDPNLVVVVESLEVVGSTILSPKDIQRFIEPVLFRQVMLRQVQDVADAITRFYVDRGFITSRAVIAPETIPTGRLRIEVIEGRLTDIQITGNRRLFTSYIRDRLQLAARAPLNANALEDQLRLLKASPFLENIEASLRPGEKPGESILVVRVQEDSQPLVMAFGIDNYVPPSIAPQRGYLSLGYQNLSGRGDEIFGSYAVGLNFTDWQRAALNEYTFTYRVPINPMEGTLQFRAVVTNNQITDKDFAALNISGESQLYELSFRQPIIRSIRQELALSTAFTWQQSQTFTFAGPTPFGLGPDDQGISRTSVLKFGVDYLYRDGTGAWLALGQFNWGLPILGATDNPDGPIPGKVIPDGRFFSFQGQGQRVQNLGNDFLLIIRGDVQLAANPLLAQQQFVIGGAQSVRGYRQNARAGDNGFRISVESRIPAARDINGRVFFQLAPFIEFGRVWNNRANPNPLITPNTLAGIGMGFLWNPVPGLDIRLDAGAPLIYNRDRGRDAQDYGIYFNLNYRAF